MTETVPALPTPGFFRRMMGASISQYQEFFYKLLDHIPRGCLSYKLRCGVKGDA